MKKRQISFLSTSLMILDGDAGLEGDAGLLQGGCREWTPATGTAAGDMLKCMLYIMQVQSSESFLEKS